MGTVKSYQDLVAWQKAMDLAIAVYRATSSFPREEIYGLTSQLRRAATSIPSNIAEGQGRNTTGEFLQFLGHARGSLFEAETQLQVAKSLSFVDERTAVAVLEKTSKLSRILSGLIASLR
jgi:four helix bundle protein